MYAAFVSGRAEGGDLWQSRMLLPHLLVQSVQAGSGVLLALSALVQSPEPVTRFLARTFAASSAANLGILGLEYGVRHPTAHAPAAAGIVVRRRHLCHAWQHSHIRKCLVEHGKNLRRSHFRVAQMSA